ncbi:hypothetical protein [Chthonobacter rhizosphaerae]|uniref:hypothetical protein n=1 Tax=Chthonobacter rhizosphaerae TaxID=2735553 RepID=UPI0015EFC613|nr:hypothetical protein [Chthonobacter rhizosphaerae]
MLLTSDEISRSTHAAWTLFKGDPAGLRQLDVSFDGFWRSFGVILLLLPALGILIASERLFILGHTAMTPETFPAGAFLLTRLLAVGLDWVDYPLLLALLARPLGLTRRYVPLVVALNWASLVAVIPITAPGLLHVLGLVGDETASFLGLFALGVVLRYQYLVTRIAVGGPVGFSIGLVALDYVSGLAVRTIATAIGGI